MRSTREKLDEHYVAKQRENIIKERKALGEKIYSRIDEIATEIYEREKLLETCTEMLEVNNAEIEKLKDAGYWS